MVDAGRSSSGAVTGDEKQEVGGASDEKAPSAEGGGAGSKQEGPDGGAADEPNVPRQVAIQTDKAAASAGSSAVPIKRPPPPRPMPSMSVIQRFEVKTAGPVLGACLLSFLVDGGGRVRVEIGSCVRDGVGGGLFFQALHSRRGLQEW